MALPHELTEFCVYTMKHQDDLHRVYSRDGRDAFEENRKWAEGRRLFAKAQAEGLKMPILFSAADRTSGLIYYAILENVEVNDDKDKPSTTYSFSNLTPLKKNPPLSSLTLKSTKRKLSDDYTRPYAICYTPSYLVECKKH